jgi:hypothetical protein
MLILSIWYSYTYCNPAATCLIFALIMLQHYWRNDSSWLSIGYARQIGKRSSKYRSPSPINAMCQYIDAVKPVLDSAVYIFISISPSFLAISVSSYLSISTSLTISVFIAISFSLHTAVNKHYSKSEALQTIRCNLPIGREIA